MMGSGIRINCMDYRSHRFRYYPGKVSVAISDHPACLAGRYRWRTIEQQGHGYFCSLPSRSSEKKSGKKQTQKVASKVQSDISQRKRFFFPPPDFFFYRNSVDLFPKVFLEPFYRNKVRYQKLCAENALIHIWGMTHAITHGNKPPRLTYCTPCLIVRMRESVRMRTVVQCGQ
jgi:hypothetical protein